MSTRRGGKKRGKPAHQNKFAFRHNPNSKKTTKLLGISHSGLCTKCNDIIQWRKKYRKYKPIKNPKKCTNCGEKRVKRAYHVVCEPCGKALGVCAKCCKEKSMVDSAGREAELEEALQKLERGSVPGLRERDRRSLLRKLAAEQERGVDSSDEEDGSAAVVGLGTAAVSSSSGGAAGGAGAGAGAGAASAVLPPSALTVSSSAPLGLVAQGGDAGMAMAS